MDRHTKKILDGCEEVFRCGGGPRFEDFEALHVAEGWLSRHGFAVGRHQRGAPRGLLLDPEDEWIIAQWRDLEFEDHIRLDGYLVFPSGDSRRGPAAVLLRPGIADRVGAPMEASL